MKVEINEVSSVRVDGESAKYASLPSALTDLKLDCIHEYLFSGDACVAPYIECVFTNSADAFKYRNYINSFNLSPEQVTQLLNKVVVSCMYATFSDNIVIDEDADVLEDLTPQEKAHLLNLLNRSNGN